MSKVFFIEDVGTSSEDEDFNLTCSQKWKRCARDDSPPALLAFSITSGGAKRGDRSPNTGPCGDLDSDPEEDESVEEWMILGEEEEEEGDSNIQLNLSYSTVSSEEDSENEALDKKVPSLQDPWAVSKKDKSSEVSSLCRYYVPGLSLFCPVCKKNDHISKNCPRQKKSPSCVLCGIQGHLQKECPGQPCSRCGLLSHGVRCCDRPPVWHQHCQRCGMTGHLCDICPDTWRQYHYTINLGVPIKLQTLKAFKNKRAAYCYNCSKEGHYGYDCRSKRMVSGTFFNLPYVCYYGTTEDILQISSRTQSSNTEFTNETQPSAKQLNFLESFGGNHKDDQLFQVRNKIKQKAHNQANFRKTWPERRRERQEVKRLRRESQARREGGVLGQYKHKPDDILYTDSFAASDLRPFTRQFKKTKKKDAGIRRTRKSRETEHCKKRGALEHGFLYVHKETDLGSELILSSSFKQRVRHRRR